ARRAGEAHQVLPLAAARARAELRREAGGEQQLQPQGPGGRAGPRGADTRLLVEQRELPAQQVVYAGMRLRGLEKTPDRVACPRRRVQRTRVPAQPSVAVDRLRAR